MNILDIWIQAFCDVTNQVFHKSFEPTELSRSGLKKQFVKDFLNQHNNNEIKSYSLKYQYYKNSYIPIFT